jgi:hypothetical protein
LNNGEIIEGEWKDGELTGHGTYTIPDGEKYVGGWKNGEFHGQETHTLTDGSKLVGEFRDDEPWEVKEYDKNGNIIGKTVNGKGVKNDPHLKLKQSIIQ